MIKIIIFKIDARVNDIICNITVYAMMNIDHINLTSFSING